jgi:xanthine dehydrogenase accessory factor
MSNKRLTWIRGAGELGSATAVTLHKAGFHVLLSELAWPLAIRRPVTFTDAMYSGKTEVEGICSVHCSLDDYQAVREDGKIPIVTDSDSISTLVLPEIIIDARMLKREINSFILKAGITVGLGPGITAGRTCQAVIETKRGHSLGKIIWDGKALSNTGIPGEIAGESKRRVIFSPGNGKIEWFVNFGKLVIKDELIGKLDRDNIKASISGIIRGLIAPQTQIKSGMKICDIDPRGAEVNYIEISDKARCVARGVLEAILICETMQTVK